MVRTSTIALLSGLFLVCGCTDIGSYSTEAGECYSGTVVDADFVRAGFEPGTRLSLTLNTDALASGSGTAGLMWSSDGRFRTEVVSQMGQLAHDSLSQFQFPGGRIRNYLVYVEAADGPPAMVVISLMENELVEVRVMRPATVCDPETWDECEDGTLPALFGVFSLNLDESCTMPAY